MKRKIISIDENKCNGCGQCANGCPEGALQMINGKARLVGELLCDGLGACIGSCPVGAITIEEREAAAYDEHTVMDNIVKAGPDVLKAHLHHLHEHEQEDYLATALDYLKEKKMTIPEYKEKDTALPCGCPGTMMKDFRNTQPKSAVYTPAGEQPSALRQWPIQLRLLNPHAPYFQNADLVIAADCVPFTYANFHSRFLKDKTLVMFCPKLDDGLDEYVDKLATIIKDNAIRSITVVRMQVPCCGGTVRILEEALQRAGKTLMVREYVISLRGEIM